MNQVSPWVARWAPLVPDGEVLDLACGTGRHAHHFAALGHAVLAVDRDPAALEQAARQGIVTLQFDLEAQNMGTGPQSPLVAGRFAGIVVTNYLHRPLMAQLAASLRPGGVLIYETFAIGNEAFGKPSNPAFLLAPGELFDIARAAGLRVLAFEDGYTRTPTPAMIQRLCAVGPDFQVKNALLDRFEYDF